MNCEKAGLSPETFTKLLSVFQRHSDVEKVILYGSRALGTHRLGSDIDLTLVSRSLSLENLLQIESEIEDLLLPYKVDLSIFTQIDSPELLEHIQRVGIEFFRRH